MAVIEPEARGGDQDSPVGSVFGGCENYEGNGEEEDCAERIHGGSRRLWSVKITDATARKVLGF